MTTMKRPAPEPLFELGRTLTTPGALRAMTEAGDGPLDFLVRHAHGDWGDVPPEDAQANEDALEHGLRILSSSQTSSGKRLWVITEADRSATTILLPEEY